MSVYFDCISQAKPCVFVYCRQRKWKESFETWTGIWFSKKTTAQTEENTSSFVLQRLTMFRQTESNISLLWPLMSICILVVNRRNSLFAPHRWNSSRQEYVLRRTFYLVESSFAFCEELAHKTGKFSSARPSWITCYLAFLVIKWTSGPKQIAVLVAIQTGVSILKTIFWAFCDLRAGKWNNCASNFNKQSCHWINGRPSCKIITKVHS